MSSKKSKKKEKKVKVKDVTKKMAKLSVDRKPLLRAADWVPAKTYVIILALGLSEWEDENDDDWNRASTLWDFFESKLPSDNMLWLDEEKDPETHLEEIEEFLGDTCERSLLIFYYAGHGDAPEDREEDYDLSFCHPDEDEEEEVESLQLSQLVETIEEEFWGSHVLMFADCCCSGQMARYVEQIQSELAYAAVTSAEEDELSTGQWTFTDCLLNGLRGNSIMDADGNGMISLQELMDHIQRQMHEVNGQSALAAHTASFNTNLNIATSSKIKAKKPSYEKKTKKTKKSKKDSKKKKKQSKDEDDY